MNLVTGFNSSGSRRLAQILWDTFSWIVAVPLALLIRYDFTPPEDSLLTAILIGFVLALVQVAVGTIFRLYRGRYVIGSFDEVLGVVVTAVFTAILGSVAVLITSPNAFPRLTIVIAVGIALASMLGARFIWRGARQQVALNQLGARTLILGAGDAGSQVVNLMLADRTHSFQPIGFIDDDPAKRHLRRSGIKVLGTQSDLDDILTDYQVEVLLVAVAGITARQLVELDALCAPRNVAVRVIPTAADIAGGAVRLGDISDVTEEDLMGRRPVTTDEAEITRFIRGKRVMVTGAGGSIGSELSRQIARYRPSELYLLDRDESALHSVQLTLDGSGTLESESLILADIRDRETIQEIFEKTRPQIVFHSAALKHLTLLERSPKEAFKTNVLGTRNILQSSRSVNVESFVNISTDKAADPTSVLGYSKLITERLTAGAGDSEQASYVSVRFGNVLGSRGSVIHTFRYQIERGGPVTVTDESVTRYFMTVKEAVHLVLQASVLGNNGDVLILDMGAPVNIAEMARYMIARSGRDIDIQFTGIRRGEKIHESLFAKNEVAISQVHPLISRSSVTPLDVEVIEYFSTRKYGRELLDTLAHHE